jgi:hypothetical protein
MEEPESCRGLSAGFRDLSLRPVGDGRGLSEGEDRQAAFLALKARSQGKRRKRQKRVHLVRNPHVCEQCFKVWREQDVKGNEKKIFAQVKGGPLRHRQCAGEVRPYFELSKDALARFASARLFSDPAYLDFFPCMGNLVREDLPDMSHHNRACAGSCCLTDRNGSMGPEPASAAGVNVVVSHHTLGGWEEQAHKTCAAASVAGALNGALHVQDCGDSAIPALERARSAGKASQSSGRVMEQDVIDYYCRWSRESGRIACHAALRGSCGLIPSTRKIGNPRLIRACHAVGASFLSNELSRNRELQNSEAASNGSLVCLPKVSKKPAATFGRKPAADSEDDVEEESDDGCEREDVSPVETLRLMGNWMCRDRIEEGGRCAPDDAYDVEDKQWARVKRELAQGSALLLHFRNHYALVFAAREWRCEASGAWRRQLLTATQKQRPHVWFCFRQLRADMIYSKVNQMLLIRRSSACSALAFPSLPSSACSSVSTGSSSAASGRDTAGSDDGRVRERSQA